MRTSVEHRRERDNTPPEVLTLMRTVEAYRQRLAEYKMVTPDKGETSRTQMVYQRGPVLAPYIEEMRNLSVAVRHAAQFKIQAPWIGNYLLGDIYTHQIRWVSLADIEQMSLPLSLVSMSQINRFLRRYPLLKFTLSKSALVAQETATILPSLDIANPHKKRLIPPTLQPLHARMTAYFDYFTNFITASHLDSEREEKFVSAVVSAGPYFLSGVGCFLPARLGITPSSALKLLEEKTVSGLYSWQWGILRKRMEKEVCHAYPVNGFPENLQKYQHYNPQADQRATELLLKVNSEQPGGVVGIDNLFERLWRYWKILRSDIFRSDRKYLEFPLDHSVIDRLEVASQYRHSLTFFVFFKDNQTHLTLEVSRNGQRIYGIPRALLREFPHIGDVLAKVIFDPVLDDARRKHPNIEPAPTIITATVPSDRNGEQADLEPDVPVKPPKRRLTLAVQSLFHDSPLPLPVEPKNRLCEVQYSRTLVVELIGRRVQDKVIDRIMATLRGFEWGEKRAKRLAALPGLYRLRVGDWRIILERLGSGNAYSISTIDNRDSVY
ncbi:hypothetical protein HYU45_04465 [Candidatus Daviesbacteria bacterium]|nr:hypothetical protein [Candidatus Daviesbacteria bacterium]